MDLITTMTEIIETTHKKEVNFYLKEGWTLLSSPAPGVYSNDGGGSYYLYTLGWNKDTEPKHPPAIY